MSSGSLTASNMSSGNLTASDLTAGNTRAGNMTAAPENLPGTAISHHLHISCSAAFPPSSPAQPTDTALHAAATAADSALFAPYRSRAAFRVAVRAPA